MTHRDAVAVLLILLGLAGMIRHVFSGPEAAATPVPRATASTFRAPGIPHLARTPDAPRPAEPVQAMRRSLREFIIPVPNIKSLPPADALAVLQHCWQTLPHETDAIPAAAFTLSDAAAAQLSASDPPVAVTLEIPGISLHTQLQLLAAQTGLQLRITAAGAILEIPAKSPGTMFQTTTLSLDLKVWSRFTNRSEQIFSGVGGGGERRFGRMFESGWEPRSGAEMKWGFPVAPSTPDGGSLHIIELDRSFHIIDLNLAPEVVEFEGFINYGSPIQTTGINALGQSEPVVLTDSKITQPVFATTIKPEKPEQPLYRLFGSMGIPEQPADDVSAADPPARKSLVWNREEGILVTTGPPPIQRLAAETAAAIRESATAGVSLEFAMGEWQDGKPPVEPAAESSKARRSAARPDKTSQPPARQTPSRTKFKAICGDSTTGPIPPLRTGLEFMLPAPSASAAIHVEQTGSCFLLQGSVVFVGGLPDILFNQSAAGQAASHFIPRQLVKPGHWHRLIASIEPGAPIPTQALFVRINRTAMPLE